MSSTSYRITNTHKWAVPPRAGTTFRIGRTRYTCLIRVGRWALIRFVADL